MNYVTEAVLATAGRRTLELLETPVSSHLELAARALGAGKHVFVEKTLAATFDEASLELNGARAGVGVERRRA